MAKAIIWGWRHYGDGYVTCEPTDAECGLWIVNGPGSTQYESIECRSLYEAERTARALNNAFQSGRRSRSRELRAFIDGADI